MKELRKQLESHVLTIETLNSENRAFVTRHENVFSILELNFQYSILSILLFFINVF